MGERFMGQTKPVYAAAPNSHMIIAIILKFGPIDLMLLVSFITWSYLSFLYCKEVTILVESDETSVCCSSQFAYDNSYYCKEVTINYGLGYKNCGGGGHKTLQAISFQYHQLHRFYGKAVKVI